MNLQLTRRGDYALRAAIHLARQNGDGYAKIREVSHAMELPLSYTPQVLGLLARAGLAEAKAGREGGYRLSRAPEEITLLEVVEAAEGDLRTNRCTLRGGPCRWEDQCAVHPFWVEAADGFRRSLAQTSLSDLVRADRTLAGLAGEPTP
jgi:Rrf2 family transcriptional regulator, iron-sulfur cluster assembly transcription factor